MAREDTEVGGVMVVDLESRVEQVRPNAAAMEALIEWLDQLDRPPRDLDVLLATSPFEYLATAKGQ